MPHHFCCGFWKLFFQSIAQRTPATWKAANFIWVSIFWKDWSIIFSLSHRSFQCRASEAAMVFLKNGDAFGRMFGYLNWVAKVFPETSDYRMLRASAVRFNECIKVNDRYRCTKFSNSLKNNFKIEIGSCWWTVSDIRSESWTPFSRYVFQKDGRNKRRYEHLLRLWVRAKPNRSKN